MRISFAITAVLSCLLFTSVRGQTPESPSDAAIRQLQKSMEEFHATVKDATTQRDEKVKLADAGLAAATERAKAKLQATAQRIIGPVVIQFDSRIKELTSQGRLEEAGKVEAEKKRFIAQAKRFEAKSGDAEVAEPAPVAEPGANEPLPGLVLAEYAKTRAQHENPKAAIPESELGRPVGVRIATPDTNGRFRIPVERTVFAKGYLVIDKPGEYGFVVRGENTGEAAVLIGTTAIEQANTENGTQTTFLQLPKGLTPIILVGRIGNGEVGLRWVSPGQKELKPIPAASLVHRRAEFERINKTKQEEK